MIRAATVDQTNGVFVIASQWLADCLWILGDFADVLPETADDEQLGSMVADALADSLNDVPRPPLSELPPRHKRRLKLVKVSSQKKYMAGAKHVSIEQHTATREFKFFPSTNDGKGFESRSRDALVIEAAELDAADIGKAVREALARSK